MMFHKVISIGEPVKESTRANNIELVMPGRGLGINAQGRIGKLSTWYHLERIKNGESPYTHIVVNFGREVGVNSINAAVNALIQDSTYGRLSDKLNVGPFDKLVEVIDDNNVDIAGVRVKFLFTDRDPSKIGWAKHQVAVVNETSGVFKDPTQPVGYSLRGHLAEGGAQKVIFSAPFKTDVKDAVMPEDSKMIVMGINDHELDINKHDVFSNASCTTNGLEATLDPLFKAFGAERIIAVDMNTVHAGTNSQSVLDKPPAKGAKDERKNRSTLDNIIWTTTGAAKAAKKVDARLEKVVFNADAFRVPTKAPSIIRATVEIAGQVSADEINDIYKKNSDDAEILGTNEAGKINTQWKVGAHYNEMTSTAVDALGFPAQAVIEGNAITVKHVNYGTEENPVWVTKAFIIAVYDNENGSYTHAYGSLTDKVGNSLPK